jgi:hypothetical protein
MTMIETRTERELLDSICGVVARGHHPRDRAHKPDGGRSLAAALAALALGKEVRNRRARPRSKRSGVPASRRPGRQDF